MGPYLFTSHIKKGKVLVPSKQFIGFRGALYKYLSFLTPLSSKHTDGGKPDSQKSGFWLEEDQQSGNAFLVHPALISSSCVKCSKTWDTTSVESSSAEGTRQWRDRVLRNFILAFKKTGAKFFAFDRYGCLVLMHYNTGPWWIFTLLGALSITHSRRWPFSFCTIPDSS